jgi:hypothetical protein
MDERSQDRGSQRLWLMLTILALVVVGWGWYQFFGR